MLGERIPMQSFCLLWIIYEDEFSKKGLTIGQKGRAVFTLLPNVDYISPEVFRQLFSGSVPNAKHADLSGGTRLESQTKHLLSEGKGPYLSEPPFSHL